MKNIPITYTAKQSEEIQNFISDHFGEDFDSIVHEIKSDYVHTDIMCLTDKEKNTFVTFGMGARKMNTPVKTNRCELVMFASSDIELSSKERCIIYNELVSISKFPFREETWLGNGHTMSASNAFKETFGYDYFALIKVPFSTKLTELDGEVTFLLLVPIYEKEREWCVNNHTLAFTDRLNEKYDGKEFDVKFKREMLIPEDIDEDEIFDYNMVIHFGIDMPTYFKLCEYIERASDQGMEITEELIQNWIKINR